MREVPVNRSGCEIIHGVATGSQRFVMLYEAEPCEDIGNDFRLARIEVP